MADSFIFGGNTGLTYEQLKQRQAVATALASRQRPYPKTLGEGIASLGESIGEGMVQRNLLQREQEYDAKRKAEIEKIYGGAAPAGPGATPPVAPASSGIPRAAGPNVTDIAVTQNQTPPVNGAGTIAGEGDPTTPPTTPSSMLAPNLPVPNLVPRPSPTSPSQAGFRAAPVYMQPALAQSTLDPAMRDYLGALSGKEAPAGPNSRSPTGPVGPLQFAGDVGAQYGLVGQQGDMRTDPGASLTAGDKLTRANVAEFYQKMGRAPTFGEVALMHQQGATGGVALLNGTVPTDPRGLAAYQARLRNNNVDPATPPQEAAQRIMAFYGMPNTPVPDSWLPGSPGASGADPKAAVASALVNQRGTQVASVNPGQTATDATAENPPTPTSIQPGPGSVRTVQIGPATDRFQGSAAAPADRLPEFVMSRPTPPDAPRQVPVDPQETAARRAAAMTSDPQLRGAYETRANELAEQRKFKQDREITLYNAKVQHYQQKDTAWEAWNQNRQKLRDEDAQRVYGLNEAAQKRGTAETFGTMPQWIVEDLTKRRDTANASVLGLEGVQNARKAMEAGALFGPGSFAKLAYYQARAELGDKDAQRIVAATQTFQSNMGGPIAQMIKQYAGKDVSRQELDYVQSIAGGKSSMDRDAVTRVLNISERAAHGTINDHRTHLDNVLAGQPGRVRKTFEANPVLAPVDVPGATKAPGDVVNVPDEAAALKLGVGKKFRLPDGRTGTVQ